MRKALSLAALCVALVGCSPAFATDDNNLEAIRRCSGVDDSVKRLACFDGVAGSLQSAADSSKAAAAKALFDQAFTGGWMMTSEQSKIDDSTTEFASVTAKEAIQTRYEQHTPRLWFRCKEHETNAIIDFGGAFVADSGGYGDVTFRVDRKPAFTRSLQESTDNQSLGFWSGGTAIPFIKSLFGGKTLIVRATPFNESAVTFEFDIGGVEEAVKPLRKACGWGAPAAKPASAQ